MSMMLRLIANGPITATQHIKIENKFTLLAFRMLTATWLVRSWRGVTQIL
ncbi:hypothetical protein LCGC14_1089490 [marine sediment metagenome]|uniref:Uncharacterized protein n=1 Tax=marine sediment metagenome TaxID=412755 RepID=A0A0F9N0H6_9ZZZZ